MYQSEIRDSEINRLLEKAADKNFGQYLWKMTLHRVRGFRDQVITFDFPVTALIGPNGGGKTTILGAGACAYKSIKPRLFFAKSGKLDESMKAWKIEYELVDKSIKRPDLVRRTASFRRHKWYRDAPEREVLTFGVTRTVPANERVEFKKFASNRFKVTDDQIERFTDQVISSTEKILGKDISKYTRIKVGKTGNFSLLTGQTDQGEGYSEFHFGAGESSIIRMVMQIEAAPDNCLILIEEIENGLHPVATARMVEYLIDVCGRKKAQAIFTTHSEDALLPLPEKAIWASIDQKLTQGKLNIRSLRAISGQVDSRLVIFTEDEFTKQWVQAILRLHFPESVTAIQVHSVEGDGRAVELNRSHNKNPSVSVPSVCFVDGDSQQPDSVEDKVFRLPGGCPETEVFDGILDLIDELKGRLSVALHMRYEDQDRVADTLRNIRRTNRDSHLLYQQAGKELGLIPISTVVDGFTCLWAQTYTTKVNNTFEPIHSMLPGYEDTLADEQEQKELYR